MWPRFFLLFSFATQLWVAPRLRTTTLDSAMALQKPFPISFEKKGLLVLFFFSPLSLHWFSSKERPRGGFWKKKRETCSPRTYNSFLLLSCLQTGRMKNTSANEESAWTKVQRRPKWNRIRTICVVVYTSPVPKNRSVARVGAGKPLPLSTQQQQQRRQRRRQI